MTTRLPHSTLAFLIAMIMALPLAFSASAQDLDATAGHLDIEELQGVESAISRSYAINISTFVDAVASDTPQPVVPAGPLLMLALVAEFDSDSHAADAASTVRDRLKDQLYAEQTGIQIEETEIDDLGDAAWHFSGSRTAGTTPVIVDTYLVQSAGWLYLAIAISENNTGNDAALALIQYSLGHRPDTEEVIYDHTGRSHGGNWEKLPAEGATVVLRNDEDAVDALSGTQPLFDTQLLPPLSPEDEDA